MYGTINTLLCTCIYFVIILYCGAIPISLVRPSFESTWYEITAQDPVKSNVTIPHNLGVYPVKVDVQVKVKIKGKDYIFTGIGSAHRDDDYDEDYGATVYIYNDVAIVVTVPVKNNNFGRGGIAYTGSSALYVGPTEIKGPYYHGFVKVRAWVANDMPPVVINMTTYMDNGNNSFKELNHTLGTYPDIVSVQIRLPTGYISDAQGAVLRSLDGAFTHFGGVVFGYDDNKIRLWAPRGTNHGVFSTYDGWGLKQMFKDGFIDIFGWITDDYNQVLSNTFTATKASYTGLHKHIYCHEGILHWST